MDKAFERRQRIELRRGGNGDRLGKLHHVSQQDYTVGPLEANNIPNRLGSSPVDCVDGSTFIVSGNVGIVVIEEPSGALNYIVRLKTFSDLLQSIDFGGGERPVRSLKLAVAVDLLTENVPDSLAVLPGDTRAILLQQRISRVSQRRLEPSMRPNYRRPATGVVTAESQHAADNLAVTFLDTPDSEQFSEAPASR